MFTPADRSRVRDQLIADARGDERVAAAALVGSAARGREDQWSDIDLALRLTDDADPHHVADSWTARLCSREQVIDHLDVSRAHTLFRVFLLASSLQIDVSFWPSGRFAATGESFRLLFGEANPATPAPQPSPRELIGMGWLYALHARSSLARGRLWQTIYMLNGLRDQVISLACLRHGVPAHQSRGVDELPAEFTTSLAGSLPHALQHRELHRAFDAMSTMLVNEAAQANPALAHQLGPTLAELVRTCHNPTTWPAT